MPAQACGTLETADPKVGSTVAAVDHITLTFTQPVGLPQSTLQVVDASGRAVAEGTAISNPERTLLSLPLSPLPPGNYKVLYSILWPDCDSTMPGDYPFTVK